MRGHDPLRPVPGPYGLSCPSAPVRGGCLFKMYAHILSFIEGPSQKWKHCANVSSTYHYEYVHAKCISIDYQGNKKEISHCAILKVHRFMGGIALK